jgi:hypothetical protein
MREEEGRIELIPMKIPLPEGDCKGTFRTNAHPGMIIR